MSHDNEVLRVSTQGKDVRRNFNLNQNLNQTPYEFSVMIPAPGCLPQWFNAGDRRWLQLACMLPAVRSKNLLAGMVGSIP